MTPEQLLLITIYDQPQPPCEKGCNFYQHCATMVRACGIFQTYVRTGRDLSPPTDIKAVTLAAITDIDT